MYIPLNFSYGLGCRSVPSAAVICNTRLLKNGRQLEGVPLMTYHICPKDRQNGPKRGNLHVTQVCSGDNRFEVEPLNKVRYGLEIPLYASLPRVEAEPLNKVRYGLEIPLYASLPRVEAEPLNKVRYGLEIPLNASLPRVEARFFMEHSSVDQVWFGRKSGINDSTTNLGLAKSDYNRCQKQHQIEWNHMQQWHEDHNLDKEFGISKKELLHSYFLAASTIFEPERSGERHAWVKSQILSSILSAYYFIKESDPSERRIEFSTGFGVKVRVDPDMKGYKDVQRLIAILFETGEQCKKDARERIGGDTGDDLLHEAWGGWLKKQGEVAEDREDIEVLVRIINICGGHMLSKEILSHIEYKSLSSLTNKICRHLRELQHKMETEKSESSKMYSEIDKDMQSLLQLVSKDSSNIGISKGIKQTFLMVAKTFYYRAYFPAQQIENHIAKVLFEQLV